MANKMIIDASHPEETRVVVLRGNRVEEFDFESASKKQLRGNIYLAKVTRVEPSLQAAFVEYGGNRHGFLAFSEIHPDYYQIPHSDRAALLEEEFRAHREEEDEESNRRRSRRHRRGSERRRSNDDERVRGDVSADGEQAVVEAAAERRAKATAPISPISSRKPRSKPPRPFRRKPARAKLRQAPEAVRGRRRSVGARSPRRLSAEPQAFARKHEIVSDPEGFAIVEETDEAGHSDAEPPWISTTTRRRSPSPTRAIAEDGAEDEEARARNYLDREQEARPARERDGEHDENGENGEGEEEEIVEQLGGDAMDETPYRAPRLRRQYKIQEVIKRRQVLLIQVVKEERGNKGAALTTYLSLAGRYSVLMPNTARGGGISRKITDAADRKRLKEIAQELEVPEGMGVILRTAGAARTKQEVKRDFEYLMRMWEKVRELTLTSSAPALVYEEGSLIKRAIRDLYSKDIDEVIVAGEDGYREARDFMRLLMPSHVKNVHYYRDPQPIFAKWGAEAQLDALFHNQVTLKSGGYLVINQTEALVAIDVNSGRSTREHNIEDTALRTNLEAADEVARQLRLRDLAGPHRRRFHRHGGEPQQSRGRAPPQGSAEGRPRPHPGRPHLAFRPARNVAPAHPHRRARRLVGGLPALRRRRHGALDRLGRRACACAFSKTPSSRAPRTTSSLRTRTDIALYILNQKRSLLRLIEERFGVSVIVEADDTLTGGAYHALERGEPAVGPSDPLRRFDPRRPIDDIEPIGEAEVEAEFEEEAEIEAAEQETDGGDRRGARRGRNPSPSPPSSRPRPQFRARRLWRRRQRAQPSDEALETLAEISGDLLAPAANDEGEDEAAREGGEGRRRGRGSWRRRNRSRSGGETVDYAGDWRQSDEASCRGGRGRRRPGRNPRGGLGRNAVRTLAGMASRGQPGKRSRHDRSRDPRDARKRRGAGRPGPGSAGGTRARARRGFAARRKRAGSQG